MHRSRFNDAFIACASFAATVFLFEVALYAPGFRPGAFTYLAVDAALTLGIVLVVVLAATIVAGSAAPQAAVVVLAALTALEAELGPMDVVRAVAVALVLVAVLAIDGELQRQPLALALVAAAAVCGAFRVWPRLSEVVDLPSNDITEAALEVLVFAACAGAAVGWSAIRHRRARRLPRESALALATLAMVTLAVTAADTYRGARPSVLPNTALPGAARPSILVLLLDTVGANRLSIYGHSRPTTPALKRFLDSSERAVLYPLAFSTASWTAPAHTSLFTGRLASDAYAEHDGASGLAAHPWPMLSQILRDQGYRTAAVVANPMLTHHTGLLDGFDVVVRWRPLHLLELTPGELLRAHWMPQLGIRATKPTPPAETVNRAVLDLVGRCAGGPCFVYANYMDAHQPYTPAPPYAGKWACAGDPYARTGIGARAGRLELGRGAPRRSDRRPRRRHRRAARAARLLGLPRALVDRHHQRPRRGLRGARLHPARQGPPRRADQGAAGDRAAAERSSDRQAGRRFVDRRSHHDRGPGWCRRLRRR